MATATEEPAGAREIVCPRTGLHLVAAGGELAVRVAQDRYVRQGGVNSVLENKHVGRIVDGTPEKRSRFDTLGRTVYFADTPQTAFAEVLQGFVKSKTALRADAEAAGLTVDEYIDWVLKDADLNDVDHPWAVSGDWQFARSVYVVRLPASGWWVSIDRHETLTALTRELVDDLKDLDVDQIHAGIVAGDDRSLTTLIAQHIRQTVLADGSLPLGIRFESKTKYGLCWAFWDRRADDGLAVGPNDPEKVDTTNVDTWAFRQVASDFRLPVLPGRRR